MAAQAQLVVVAGPDQGRKFLLQEPILTIGRHSDNSIHLNDPRVSRKHCELRAGPAKTFQLFDLKSGNGTLVNGRVIQAIELRENDRITIGDTTMVFFGAYHSESKFDDATRVIMKPEVSGASAVIRTYKADDDHLLAQRRDAAMLSVMFEVADAVAHLTDLDLLLGRVLELLLRTIPADHACALLFEADGGPMLPRAVRARSGASDELIISRTILDLAMASSEAIQVRDAGTDERFRGGESIAKHQLRDVICVPLRGRRETVGAIFMDTVSANRLTEEHLPLSVAIGHQAAVAIEETKHYEARLQAERLAVVGQTMAAMSHHIKNIMHGIRFGSDMVRKGLDNDPEMLRKGWQLVERNQARIDDLILDMLNYSKAREPGHEPTDLIALTSDAIELIRGPAESRGVTIRWEPIPIPMVRCDPAGVHRAILNLLSNAVDAVEGQEGALVAVRSEVRPGYAAIVVCDNGPGIAPEKVEELFKPFVSTKGARGTGLGLPVSRKIMQEHGGNLEVSAAPGGGACFTLILPLPKNEA